MATRKPPHYIITVHGIGEQAENETSQEVVQRFAEVRQGEATLPEFRALLPANLSSYAVRRQGQGPGWSEFRGIPVDPKDKGKELFDGTRASTTAGKNFRFVDLRWADILQEHQARFSSPIEAWTEALLHRLQPPFTPPNWSAPWMNPLLQEIKATILPFQRLLKWYKPSVAHLIFDDILGDVHLYGDFARTRGQAVRRFHSTLDQIHLRDYEQWCRFERTSPGEQYRPPSYTILAHSLGSVMSFDALVYAFANSSIRAGKTPHASGSLPFPGYRAYEAYEKEAWDSLIEDIQKNPARSDLPKGEKNLVAFKRMYPQFTETFPCIPPLFWRKHIANFITLGSPIDKFHVLWHQNYRHMGLQHCDFSDEWAEGWQEKEVFPKIPHYNLCDEQDPVGHHLELTEECQNYRKIFDTSIPVTYRDIVFRRYPVPGVAHTQYWKDQELFKILIESVIDRTSTHSEYSLPSIPKVPKGTDKFVQDSFIEVPGCYREALEWAYFRLPFLTAVVTSLLLGYGIIQWQQEGFALSYLLSILTGLLLWVMPRPAQGYHNEVAQLEENSSAGDQKKTHRERGFISRMVNSWWECWKPRPGLFANLVRGAVTWRRILIWLKQHPNQAFTVKDALRHGVRRSLKSPGDFKAHVTWRTVLVLPIVGGTSWVVMFGWPQVSTLGQLSQYLAEWLYVASLMILISSACYVAVMAYVGFVFMRMKRQSHNITKEEDVKEKGQADPSRVVDDVMDHPSAVNFK